MWLAWFKESYPDDEVLLANHKNDPPGTSADAPRIGLAFSGGGMRSARIRPAA